MRSRLHYVFFILALYSTLVILMAALGAVTFFTGPGKFLFSRFHLASLYIPSILFIGGILLKSGRLPGKTMETLWLSPIVFLTLTLALQISFGRTEFLVVEILTNAPGAIPAAVFFFLLFSLEIIGIVKLASINRNPGNVLLNFEELKAKFHAFLVFLGLENPEITSDESTRILNPNHGHQLSPPVTVFPEKSNSSAITALLRNVFIADADADANEETISPSPQDSNTEPVIPPVMPGEEDPAFEYLVGSLDDAQEAPADGGYNDVSAKLDPHGTAPKGVVIEPRNEVDVFTGNRTENHTRYFVPVEGLLAEYPNADFSDIDEHIRHGAEILEQTLNEFKIEARVTGISAGPVITMYELLPSPGVKISSIVNLQDNIALRLAASQVRIVAPIPGKHAIGIEVPNKNRAIVSFSALVKSNEFQKEDIRIPVVLGKDINGGNHVIDLTRTPHLLIAGATGSGKSVCVNSLICSILYSRNPQEVKMIMVDPKIVELKLYNDIPHLLTQVITEPKRALQSLQWCLYEMERRYSLLDSQGVRDVTSFNRRVHDRNLATVPLPFIVVIIDEFADLMATSGKELEGIVARLAAMSRAVGIHLVLATQRPSVDVITGLIKANFPSRIAFMVAGKTDSRIIIDTIGAEKLLGRGDMLFTSAWNPFPSRIQGAFLAEEEVERVVAHVKTLGEPDYIDEEMFFDDDENESFQSQAEYGDDPLYNKALDIVMSTRKTSASWLQRQLKIGYNRAASLVEEMERRGILGPPSGSKPREIIHIPESA